MNSQIERCYQYPYLSQQFLNFLKQRSRERKDKSKYYIFNVLEQTPNHLYCLEHHFVQANEFYNLLYKLLVFFGVKWGLGFNLAKYFPNNFPSPNINPEQLNDFFEKYYDWLKKFLGFDFIEGKSVMKINEISLIDLSRDE